MVGNQPRGILRQGPARLLQLLRQPVAALKLHGDHSPIVQVLGAKRTSDGAGGGDPHLNLARRRLHELFLRGRSFLALGPLAALAFRGGRFAGLGRRSGGGLGHGRGLGSHLRLKLMAQLGQQLFGPLHRGHDLDAVSIVDELPKLQRSRAENHGRLRVPHQGDAQRRADGIQDLLLLLGVGARLGDAAEGLRRCGADLLGAWCGGWRLLPLLVLCNLGRRLLLGSLPGLLCFSRLLGDEQPSTRLRTRLL
mmetsp:Transcript_9607/g.26794  ORF Transcript_9607/g.26794 Transcript_9607/m.26794 type:complete len:251 (+) Transcript_9607:555-1307(+)